MPNVMAKRPTIGDECWFVEWCIELGLVDAAHPEYGCDPDKNKLRTRCVATRDEAMQVAKQQYPNAIGGVVSYWPATFTPNDDDDAHLYPHAGFWETTADPEHYEGE